MRLNPKKCTFGVKAEKFLHFYLAKRGTKANRNKCEAIIKMETPTNKETIMKLKRMLIALNKLISRFAQHALPFLQTRLERGLVRVNRGV
jgi:hypothetical protein